MKSKSKESRHPWRENLEATSMAIVVALLFKTFILEVSKIPSGSMQPTLIGNAQARIYDRVLVDKLSFQFRDPERFEIVVFRHPIERSRVMVKRLFGMPEEDLRIRNGDVWTRKGPEAEWAVQRRPASVMKESWKRLDPESPKRSSWGVGSGGESWRISGRDIRARGNGRARFRPGKTSITDHYRDGYPESLADLIPIRDPGLTDQNDVGDLRVEGRVRALRGTERVVIELTEGNRIY
ncbi:MAG: signal peptidase I [Planctomycetota bacterium]|nr:signal peptidase I [Planctomycetota bacterium]